MGGLFINMKQSSKQYKFAVRRLKRCSDKLQKERLAQCLLNSKGNIFNEVKKIRGKSINYSRQIDEHVGAEKISNHFSSIYGKLYNSVKLDSNFDSAKEKVLNGVNLESEMQYSRITENVVRRAVQLLKPKKRDAFFNIASDFYLNGPD